MIYIKEAKLIHYKREEINLYPLQSQSHRVLNTVFIHKNLTVYLTVLHILNEAVFLKWVSHEYIHAEYVIFLQVFNFQGIFTIGLTPLHLLDHLVQNIQLVILEFVKSLFSQHSFLVKVKLMFGYLVSDTIVRHAIKFNLVIFQFLEYLLVCLKHISQQHRINVVDFSFSKFFFNIFLILQFKIGIHTFNTVL